MRTLLLAALSLTLSPAFAQQAPVQAGTMAQPEPKPSTMLKAGDPAPPFRVDSFIQGPEVTDLRHGKIWVVEFWATWCGPCIAGIPHLTKLQKEFKDHGVTIIGVNIWEEREYTPDTINQVRDFVAKQGERMGYPVAYDGPGKFMDAHWMQAAGRNGIPSAFIVDREGIIAWIGHPMQMDMVLDELVAGTWDIAKGPDRIKAARDAVVNSLQAYAKGVAEGDRAWDEVSKAHPRMAGTMKQQRYAAVLQAGHFDRAFALGRELLNEGLATKDLQTVMGVAFPYFTMDNPPARMDRALLQDVAKAVLALGDPKSSATYMQQARIFFVLGDFDAGRAAGAQAVQLAPEQLRERYQGWLNDMETDARAAAQKRDQEPR
jgi:thiol-disulfide isomerase/thioredoxin